MQLPVPARSPEPQLSLLEVVLGTHWYEEYLATGASEESDDGFESDGFGGRAGRRLRRRGAGLDFDAPGAGGSDGRQLWWWQRPPSAQVGSSGEEAVLAGPGLWPFGGGAAGAGASPSRQSGGGGVRQAGVARARVSRPPVFAMAQVQYGKHQSAESQPVRVSPGGRATFLESFVFATKRCGLRAHMCVCVCVCVCARGWVGGCAGGWVGARVGGCTGGGWVGGCGSEGVGGCMRIAGRLLYAAFQCCAACVKGGGRAGSLWGGGAGGKVCKRSVWVWTPWNHQLVRRQRQGGCLDDDWGAAEMTRCSIGSTQAANLLLQC
jgi:hypothetical protein